MDELEVCNVAMYQCVNEYSNFDELREFKKIVLLLLTIKVVDEELKIKVLCLIEQHFFKRKKNGCNATLRIS